MLLFALVLVLSACTGGAASETTLPTPPVDRLVIIDETGNIVTINPDGSDAVAVSDDGGVGVVYFQPMWSPSSDQLAWGRVSEDGFLVGIGDPDGADAGAISMPNQPFYLYWSPNGRWIGALHNASAGGIDLEIVDAENQETSVAATGAPFYFSWDESGSQMIAHIGDRGFQLIEVNGDLTDLGDTGPAYQAPQWTSAGVFHIRGGDLILLQPEGTEEIVATVGGPSTFVSNSEGSRVALQSVSAGGIQAGIQAMPAIPLGGLVVLDVASGEVEVVSEGPSIGYFWSPDGESLLIYEPTSVVGTVDLMVWHEGETSHLVTYDPPGSFFRDVLPFFTQYAQSIELWSPDSTSVAFAGDFEGERGVWIQAISGGEPEYVSDGHWVAWSNG